MVGARLPLDLGEFNGVRVALAAIDCEDDETVIRLFARRSALTDALDARFDTAFGAWAAVAMSAKAQGELSGAGDLAWLAQVEWQ